MCTPTPGGFWQRVRKWLKTMDLRFCDAQKSAQEFEKKGLDVVARDEW